MADYTIEQYLKGKVDLSIPDSAINAILYDRGVQQYSIIQVLSRRDIELCLADVYVWAANSSVVTQGESESDGGWARKKATKNVFSRDAFIQKANRIYKSYGLEEVSSCNEAYMHNLY